MFTEFPYTNFHDLNLDWIIKIAKDFLDQYTHIQEVIATGEQSLLDKTDAGLTQLQEKADALESALTELYNGYSDDLAEQLRDALADLNEWYTQHQDYLDDILAQNTTAFQESASAYGASVIASIPSEYGDVTNNIKAIPKNTESHIFESAWNYFYGYGYFNSNLEWTDNTGLATLKIPLASYEFIILSHPSADFMIGISGNYRFMYELKNGTKTRTTPTGSDYTRGTTHTDGNYEAVALGFQQTKYIYIAVDPSKVDSISVLGSRFPFFDKLSFLSEQAIYTINAYNSVYVQAYFDNSQINLLTISHVFWKVVHQGDIITNLALQSGLSYYGSFKSSDDTVRQRITTSTFTVPKNGFICLFTDGSLRAQLIPALRFKLYASDIIGSETENAYYGLAGVAFGTSLTYRSETTGGYLNFLPTLSGMTWDNQGIGSGKIKMDILNRIRAYTGYAGKRVAIIEGFCNDFGYNATVLGQYTDNTDATVCGCIRQAITYIQTQNQNITIFLVLDHYGREYNGVNSSSTALNTAGLNQYAFYNEIAKVAESLGVMVIPLYKMSGIDENTPQYLMDNIHPTALGAQQTANAIWAVMKSVYPNAVA